MERNDTIDMMKGIGIISVVLGHCWLLPSTIIHFIYSFHMPLFFIVAGYFYKEREVYASLQKDARRLLFPYIVFATIFVLKFTISSIIKYGDFLAFFKYSFIAFYASAGNHTSYYLSWVPDIGVIWFLPAMFVCKNVYNVLYKQPNGCFLTTIVAITATLIDVYLVNLPLGILVGCSAMIFYQIGFYLKTHKINFNLFIVGLFCWFISLKYSGISVGCCRYGIYPVDIIGASVATILIYLIFKQIHHLHHNCKHITNGLRWFGKYSMIVLCMHYLEQIIDINSRVHTESWYLYLTFEFLLIIFFTYFCTKNKYTKLLFQLK